MSAMPERMIKAYVSKERIEVPHPNPLIATYVYDGEPRAPDEVEGWIVIAPHSEPPVPESRLLAAEARVREVEAEMLDTAQQAMRIRAERECLVPLARVGLFLRDKLLAGVTNTDLREHFVWCMEEWAVAIDGEDTPRTTQARAILAREAGA